MARDDLAASASRVLAVVARRGRSHGDDEAARRVGGGGVEADGGEGRSEEEERTGHTFYTIEPLVPGENTTRCQKGPKALVGRPPGANGEP